MTSETFIARLKYWTKTAPENWWINQAGELRTKKNRCPITCVAKHEKDKAFPVTQYDDAAEVLGIPIHLADRIVWAADHVPSPEPNPNYEPVLRKHLLAACGVAEADG